MLTRLIGVMLLLIAVTGCGQKGPLVLPPEGAEVPQQSDRDEDKK